MPAPDTFATGVPVLGALYAGGQGRRLGGQDKAQIVIGRRRLIDYALPKLTGAAQQTIFLAPEPRDWMSDYPNARHVPDQLPDGADIGPAGGLLAALEFAFGASGPDSVVVTCPIDVPFFPEAVLLRLVQAIRGDTQAAVLETEGRLQPTFAAIRADQASDLRVAIDDGMRALHALLSHMSAEIVSTDAPPDAFRNINTPEDLHAARTIATRHAG